MFSVSVFSVQFSVFNQFSLPKVCISDACLSKPSGRYWWNPLMQCGQQAYNSHNLSPRENSVKPYTFISYSRQCMGFVDDLAHRLELQGFGVWLDYRSLIPGRHWLEQIHKGLDGTDLLLLVVSPESIASRAVELEWRHFLEGGRRVILLIFQAVPLPPELSSLEWVDFRGSYGAALRRLVHCIESPLTPAKPPPQSGFKAPLTVWLAAALSVFTALYSLFAFWTFLIPWVLVPLPARILKRNFNLPKVQTALWALPLAIFFGFLLMSELGLVNMDAEFDSTRYFSLYNLGSDDPIPVDILRPIHLDPAHADPAFVQHAALGQARGDPLKIREHLRPGDPPPAAGPVPHRSCLRGWTGRPTNFPRNW